MIPVTRPAPIRGHEFQAFRALIRRVAGIELSDAKREMVASRLARRLRLHGYTRYEQYLEHLRREDADRSELREMVNCLTTNKTSFFREPHHFEFLAQNVFPRAGERLSIWSAGCSTGEEPYSLAIVARQAFGAAAAARVRILGTDIDTNVLETARAGVYDAARLADVPAGLFRRHFVRTRDRGDRWRVHPDTAGLVQFGSVNLAGDRWPAVGRFDVIFCRNVIIYLAAPVRQQLMRRFAERLNEGGHLILGHAESLTCDQEWFEPVGQTVFRLRAGARSRHGTAAAPAAVPPRAHTAPSPRAGATPAVPAGRPERRIVAGEFYASGGRELVRTLLGSCVAACLWDPEARVGGMNHFMLPDGFRGDSPARYGVHAMEMLVNRIMRLGGDRRRLRAKAFGGASLLDLQPDGKDVGEENARFVREFLSTEGIPLVAERLGGNHPLEVRMLLDTGQVYVRAVETGRVCEAEEQERRYRSELTVSASVPPDITLF